MCVFILLRQVSQGRSVMYAGASPGFVSRTVACAKGTAVRIKGGARGEKEKSQSQNVDCLPFGQTRDPEWKRPCGEMNLLNATVISEGRAEALLFESRPCFVSAWDVHGSRARQIKREGRKR